MAKRKTNKRRRRKPRKVRLTAYGVVAVLALLVAVAAFIARPYIKERHEIDKGAPVPAGYYCYGIDISKYQSEIEWDKLKVLTDARGRTEGTTLKDKCFRRHWNNADKAGIRRGAYHFFRSSKDARQQALHFIRTVGTLSEEDLPPVLDIETIHKGCSKKALNDKALIWLKMIEQHYGRKPIVYSSASFIEDIICTDIKDNYPIWVAHYQTRKPRCNRWHFWQFAEDAVVYGIEGKVDLNVTSEETLKSL